MRIEIEENKIEQSCYTSYNILSKPLISHLPLIMSPSAGGGKDNFDYAITC